MKIVNLDGHTTNPGDLSWDGIKELGEYTVYDRTAPEEIVERVMARRECPKCKAVYNMILNKLHNRNYRVKIILHIRHFNIRNCTAGR